VRASRRIRRGRFGGALPLAIFVGLSLAAAALVLHGVAEARPGSGQGFSSPSSGSGSRSSGGGSSRGSGGDVSGQALFLLLRLAFQEPAIGIPLIVVVVVVLVLRHRWAQPRDWRSTPSDVEESAPSGASSTEDAAAAPDAPSEPRKGRKPRRGRAALVRIAETDPAFSVVLFEDFVYALYARLHEARGGAKLATLAPFLSPAAREALEQRSPGVERVEGIVVGAFRVEKVEGLKATSDEVRVVVRFESNYTETTDGEAQAMWVEERWTLVRSKQAKSRSPDKARTVDCPECGGSIEKQVDFKCRYCGTSLAAGVFDWMVESVELVDRATAGPALTTHAEERGTTDPTRFAPGVHERMAALSERDPSVTWGVVSLRVETIFAALQVGWSRREEALVRPHVSDALYHYLRYWLETYRKAGLRNVTEGARIVGLELADARTDAWLDALVVRVFATGLDVTVDEDGKHVSGDPDHQRDYTEYWTLIRSVRKKGAPPDAHACPSCGAPLEVEMAGNCKACRTHVTSGEFDWVLSKIEQDEVYTG